MRKTVVAAGVLVLVAEGRLALDLPLAGPAFTLRQLFQHTAGVPNYGGSPAITVRWREETSP